MKVKVITAMAAQALLTTGRAEYVGAYEGRKILRLVPKSVMAARKRRKAQRRARRTERLGRKH